MRIGIPAEILPGETRVAATPETVSQFTAGGRHEVLVERGAGIHANLPDAAFATSGASLGSAADVYSTADLILKVRRPIDAELPMLRRGRLLVGFLAPPEGMDRLAQTGVTAFAMELVPRITRAQNMDALSSQANIAGYKAAVVAAYEYGRYMPMLITAAGTVKAARVLVLGAGVAGLQAIATAKRLGALVEACDIRPAVKEEVESLGAKFVDPALLAERAKATDIVITTALVSGKRAPVLLTEDMVASMQPGSVVVDLAVMQGGNCALSQPDTLVLRHGVKILAPSNLAATMPADASALYARNLLHFTRLLLDPKTGALNVNRSDDIIAATLVCVDGAPVRS